MKVLHVAPSISRSYGGPTEALCAYANAAAAAGIDVEVLAPGNETDGGRMRERMPGVPVHVHRSVGAGAFVFSPSLLAWLARQDRFDIVHVHGTLNAVSSLAALVSRLRGLPYVVRPFGTLSRYTFHHRRTALKRLYFCALDRHGVLGASALHFTTEQEREEASWRSVPLPPSFVIPLPFYAVPASEMTRLPAERAVDGPTVLFLSRLHPVKNLEALVDAWPLVLVGEPQARLFIAGEGERTYVESLERRIGQREAGNIEFCGFVSGVEKSHLLSRADLFVLPSHHENFGVAALEAMAAGVPVVVSEEVQLSRFVSAHGLGRVVQRDAKSIATGILEALHDPLLRARCTAEGRACVEREFSPAVVGSQLRDMYHRCLETATPGRRRAPR